MTRKIIPHRVPPGFQRLIALLLVTGAVPAMAQQGCEFITQPSQRQQGLVYVIARRDASTLSTEELKAQIRALPGYEGREGVVEGVQRYDFPGYGAFEFSSVFIQPKGAGQQVAAGYDTEPAQVEATAAKMCKALARIDVPWERKAPPRPQDRTAPPPVVKNIEVVAPDVPYFVTAAHQALGEGEATITGPACVSHMGRMQFPIGLRVYLYPASAYTEQLVALDRRARQSEGRQMLRLADSFLRFRLEGKTNEVGHFRFANLKPGRYFLTAQHASTFEGEREVSVASYTNSMGFRSYINELQAYSQNFNDTLEKFVTVKRGQKEVTVHLTPGGMQNLFGCR